MQGCGLKRLLDWVLSVTHQKEIANKAQPDKSGSKKWYIHLFQGTKIIIGARNRYEFINHQIHTRIIWFVVTYKGLLFVVCMLLFSVKFQALPRNYLPQ